MNSLGLGILFNMGCTCTKESVCINGKRYVVKSRLGEGGFSVVDLVYDANSQRMYALKRIPCHTRESERDAMREAELYKSFDHPNLVRCVDAALVPCHDLSKPFSSEVLILLPYFRRGTLQDELTMRARSRDHMPESRLLEIFTGMCQGVQAIHSATPVALAHSSEKEQRLLQQYRGSHKFEFMDMYHYYNLLGYYSFTNQQLRDLKPANVLLADDDVPVWMDFGSMGRARLDIGRTSEAIALQDLATEKCSMSYRAPELFNVESRTSIDERVDIWSLGCCLYAMCFFRSPFDSAHERGDSVALAVLSGHVDIPSDSPYSGGLHGLIRTMLEVDCLQRPFIESVLEQVTALAASANHKV